jgi:hypothetical protein
MAKCINGHIAYKSAMAVAIVTIPEAPPLEVSVSTMFLCRKAKLYIVRVSIIYQLGLRNFIKQSGARGFNRPVISDCKERQIDVGLTNQN